MTVLTPKDYTTIVAEVKDMKGVHMSQSDFRTFGAGIPLDLHFPKKLTCLSVYLNEAFVDVPIRKPKVMALTFNLLTADEKAGYLVQMVSYDAHPQAVLLRRKSLPEMRNALSKAPAALYPKGLSSNTLLVIIVFPYFS
jgi:hypothetical protein